MGLLAELHTNSKFSRHLSATIHESYHYNCYSHCRPHCIPIVNAQQRVIQSSWEEFFLSKMG